MKNEGKLNRKEKSNNQATDYDRSNNQSKISQIFKDELKKEISGVKEYNSPSLKKSIITESSNVGFISQINLYDKNLLKKKKKVRFALKNIQYVEIQSFKEEMRELCFKPQMMIEIRKPSCSDECKVFFSKCNIY